VDELLNWCGSSFCHLLLKSSSPSAVFDTYRFINVYALCQVNV